MKDYNIVKLGGFAIAFLTSGILAYQGQIPEAVGVMTAALSSADLKKE